MYNNNNIKNVLIKTNENYNQFIAHHYSIKLLPLKNKTGGFPEKPNK